MDTFKCFWCNQTFKFSKVTEDHIIPRLLLKIQHNVNTNGITLKTNIVRSCKLCNENRGEIMCFYSNILEMMNKTDRNERRIILLKRMYRRVRYYIQLQRKWKDIEVAKLGFSPSDSVLLVVIDGATQKPFTYKIEPKPYSLILEEARVKAEQSLLSQQNKNEN